MSILRFRAFEVDHVFEVDTDTREIRKNGSRLHVRDQPMCVLLALIEQAGSLVTREQLRHQLWPTGTFVDFDRAINKAVSELRSALGDPASSSRIIETLSKRGYRFRCPVERSTAAFPPPREPPSDAYVACVTGRYLWSRRTVRDLNASLGYFTHALEIDEDCAPARAGLADAHVLSGIWGLRRPDAACADARRAANQALARDPRLAEAHTTLAEVLIGYEFDWRRAEARFQHALSLQPDYATAHQWYAQMLVSLGRYAEAAAHMAQARRADPVSPAITAFLPNVALAARDYNRALREAQGAVDLEPHAPLAWWYLGRAYLFANQPEEAVHALESGVTLIGPASMWIATLCYARARAGDRTGALRLLSDLVERGGREHVSSYDLAIAFAGIGDRTTALDHLEQAYEHRERRILCAAEPELDALHDEPRYQRLLDRLHLPAAPV